MVCLHILLDQSLASGRSHFPHPPCSSQRLGGLTFQCSKFFLERVWFMAASPTNGCSSCWACQPSSFIAGCPPPWWPWRPTTEAYWQKIPEKRRIRRSGSPSCCSRLHGGQMWNSAVPNKLKVFAWLYFKDRLITRVNLHSKHVLEDNIYQRCNGDAEDRHPIFFACNSISFLWSMIGISSIETATDEDFWTSLLHEDLTQPFGLWLYDNLPMVPMGCKEWWCVPQRALFRIVIKASNMDLVQLKTYHGKPQLS